MPQPQRLILEDDGITYDVLIDSSTASSTANQSPQRRLQGSDHESYSPDRSGNKPADATRVKLVDVHNTIKGYTQYAIGAFKNLAIADVEEITLKFNIKISAEGGLPIIASAKTESDFAIEVKCKFPKSSSGS